MSECTGSDGMVTKLYSLNGEALFDAMSALFPKATTTAPGIVLTGAIIAGGSKGAVKLFRDVMGFKTSAEVEYEEE